MWRKSFRDSVEEGKDRSYNLISSTLQLKQKYEWDSQESGHVYICHVSSSFHPLFNQEWFLWTFSFLILLVCLGENSAFYMVELLWTLNLFCSISLFFTFVLCSVAVVVCLFVHFLHKWMLLIPLFLIMFLIMLKAIVCAFTRGFISFGYLNMT